MELHITSAAQVEFIQPTAGQLAPSGRLVLPVVAVRETNMSVLTVSSISVLNNPAPFTAPLEFEVHYEAIQDLEDGRSGSSGLLCNYLTSWFLREV